MSVRHKSLPIDSFRTWKSPICHKEPQLKATKASFKGHSLPFKVYLWHKGTYTRCVHGSQPYSTKKPAKGTKYSQTWPYGTLISTRSGGEKSGKAWVSQPLWTSFLSQILPLHDLFIRNSLKLIYENISSKIRKIFQNIKIFQWYSTSSCSEMCLSELNLSENLRRWRNVNNVTI